MKDKTENKGYAVRIGIGLKNILDKQIKNIDSVTYDCVKASYYEAGEILAKKIELNKLV